VRILFFPHYYWPAIGGAERFARDLARGLRDREHEVLVLTTQPKPEVEPYEEIDSIPVHRISAEATLDSKDPLRVVSLRRWTTRLFGDFAPDIVHFSSVGHPHFFAPTLPPHTPLLVSLHNVGEAVWNWCAAVGHLERADWFTVPSRACLPFAPPGYRERSSAIYHGLPVPAARPAVPPPPPRLLCLGRLTGQKGFELAIEAMPFVLQRHADARLIVAGDGEDMNALWEQTRRLGLADSVHFTGYAHPDAVPALLSSVHVVLMPSLWEGLPYVAIEAAAMARPLIVSAAEGITEVIHHEHTGTVVPERDPVKWAQAICDVLEHPAEAWARGERARQMVVDLFSPTAFIDNFESLYRRLIDERAAKVSSASTKPAASVSS
jgi:glycosyltransferase involved in cell wall biosynthesis